MKRIAVKIAKSDLSALKEWAGRLSEKKEYHISISDLLRHLSYMRPEDIESFLPLARQELGEHVITNLNHGEAAHSRLKELARATGIYLYQLYSIFAHPEFQAWAEGNFITQKL